METAGAVLAALLALGGGAALTKIATKAGLGRGKAHRYLASLTRAGLTARTTAGGYEIGTLALSLGLAALRRINPIGAGMRALPRLRDATDQTATLAVWGVDGPVVVGLEPARRAVALNVRIGVELPAEATALGRALRPRRGNAARDAHAVSFVDGALFPGVAACAAPVFDHAGQIALAVGAVGRSEDFQNRDALADAVRSAAAALSAELGFDDTCFT